MGYWDYQVVLFLNQLVHRSWTLDTFLYLCVSSPLLRGGTAATLIWWVWFKEGKQKRRSREILLFGIVACVCGVWLARAVAHLMPFRARPIHNPALALRLAEGITPKALFSWSSFPSDHATLFACLAVCLWLASRSAGAVAAAQALFLVCLPRVILGIHYPSDILAGVVIGCAVAQLARSSRVRSLVAGRALEWEARSPKHFYAAFFLATYMLGTVFDLLAPVLSLAIAVARATLARAHNLAGEVSGGVEWAVAAFLCVAVASLLVILIRSVWIPSRTQVSGRCGAPAPCQEPNNSG